MSHSHSKRNQHTPRHNKISLTHDRGLHAENVLYKCKPDFIDTSVRPASRAYVNGVYYPLHSIKESKGEV